MSIENVKQFCLAQQAAIDTEFAHYEVRRPFPTNKDLITVLARWRKQLFLEVITSQCTLVILVNKTDFLRELRTFSIANEKSCFSVHLTQSKYPTLLLRPISNIQGPENSLESGNADL